MRDIDLNKIYDKNNKEASELYEIATMMYGDNFHLIFDKYIFIHRIDPENSNEIKGLIVNTLGEIMFDGIDIVYIVPMIYAETNEINGYLVFSKDDYEIIKKILNTGAKVKKHRDCTFNIEDLLGENNTEFTEYINIIEKDGSIIEYKLTKLGETREDALKRIYKSNFNYKNKSYQIVLDSNKNINYLVCTQ